MFWTLVIILIIIILRFIIIKYCLKYLPPPLHNKEPSISFEELNFGESFTIGTATSSWQIEKEVQPSNWSLFEKRTRKDGTACCPPHLNGCDAIKQFDTDLTLMESMNLTSYRFSLSWSALNPHEGYFDEVYLQHYIEMCDKLLMKGIEPYITLLHFELPSWLEEIGGLCNDNFDKYYKEYLKFVIPKLKGHCINFFTINEPSVHSMMSYLFGSFAPGIKSLQKFKISLITLMRCHSIGYKFIHKIIPESRVSYAKQIIEFQPIHRWSLIEILITYLGNQFFNSPTLDCIQTGKVEMNFFGIKVINERIKGLKDSIDFIGVNHYTIIFASINPKDWSGRKEFPIILSNYTQKYRLSDCGWSLVPESLLNTVEWVNARWNARKLNIIISEHGISDQKDDRRPQFITESLLYLKEGIDKYKLPVKGYMYWSLLDNYEWADGYKEHFGLIEVNLETQERKKRGTCEIISEVALKCKNDEKKK